MDEAAGISADTDVNHAIADLGELPLARVLASGDSALDQVIRLVSEQFARPGDNYAAHGTTP